jgi:outer membrane protein assembly factor BamA
MAPSAGWSGNVTVAGALCDYVASKHFVKPTASLQMNRTVPLLGLTFSSSLHCGGIFMPLAQRRNAGYIRVCDRFFLGSERVRGFQNQGLGPRAEHTAVPRSKVDSGGGDDNDWTSMWGDALGGDLYGSALVSASGLLPQRKLASFGMRWHVFANCGTLVRHSSSLHSGVFQIKSDVDLDLHRLSGFGRQR